MGETLGYSLMEAGDDLKERVISMGKLAMLLGEVERSTLHPDGVRRETDTTHTVMLAIIACQIASECGNVDVGRVAQFAIVHDLVEALSGDTCTFKISENDRAAKQEREAKALAEIMKLHAHNTWLIHTLQAYEDQEEREARFVRVLDKAMPKVAHALNQCKSVRDMGHSFSDLVNQHESQLDALMEEYSDMVDTGVFFVLEQIMEASEESWPLFQPASSRRYHVR